MRLMLAALLAMAGSFVLLSCCPPTAPSPRAQTPRHALPPTSPQHCCCSHSVQAQAPAPARAEAAAQRPRTRLVEDERTSSSASQQGTRQGRQAHGIQGRIHRRSRATGVGSLRATRARLSHGASRRVTRTAPSPPPPQKYSSGTSRPSALQASRAPLSPLTEGPEQRLPLSPPTPHPPKSPLPPPLVISLSLSPYSWQRRGGPARPRWARPRSAG